MEDYCEYIFPEIKSDHIIISIQILYDSNLGAHPYIKINDHYFNYKFLEKQFQFLKLDKDDIFKIVNFIGDVALKINILNISNFNNNIKYEEKAFQIKKFIDEKYITFYIEPFVLNKNIKYVLHIFTDNSYKLEQIYNNNGGISRNITFEKNSTSNDVIEYTFENFDFNASYDKYIYFLVIATDFETGYTYNYINEKVDTIVHEEIKSNKVLIIFGIVFGIFIIILIIFLVLREKKKEKDSSKIINDNSKNEKILSD